MGKTIVFMIMPFDGEFLLLFENLQERFKDNYSFTHAGDLENQRNILKDIVIGIHNADIIITDVSFLNPNVFYELGIAHALNKKVIIITQSIDELPFDIKQYRAHAYDTHFAKIPRLFDYLTTILEQTVSGTVQFGSPVSDFLPDLWIASSSETATHSSRADTGTTTEVSSDVSEEDEKGLLDFVVEIDEDMAGFTKEIYSMTTELQTMATGIQTASDEINLTTKMSGGNSSAVYTRNIARKVAEGIGAFGSSMTIHNQNVREYWAKIENNFLDLIDNKFLKTEENKNALKKSLASISALQIAMSSSNENIIGFTEQLSQVKGIERRLTHAANVLADEMNIFINFVDQAYASIDRIQEKGKLAIGEA